MKKYGIIITTVGDKMGIRDISEKEKDRFIQWMEDDDAYPMFSSEFMWDRKPKKVFVVKRMVCGFEVFQE